MKEFHRVIKGHIGKNEEQIFQHECTLPKFANFVIPLIFEKSECRMHILLNTNATLLIL